MILGIDVGGTYSDGVLISNNKIINQIKVKTNSEDLISSIKEIKKSLNISDKSLEKVIVSTTLMTNFIVEKKYEKIGLFLIPGPGMVYSDNLFPFPYKLLKGGIDFQGRLISDIDKDEVIKKTEEFLIAGIDKISVNGKFSPRNPVLENKVYEIIKKNFPELKIEKGIDLSGNLNFIRRSISSGLKIASEEVFENFLKALITVFPDTKNINILKSDGGLVPLELSKNFSVETIFSGPAASAFGALALLKDIQSALVIDIGGTTSDYSLILNKEPLFASKGIKINNFYTTARGLSVFSLPLGGDTKINFHSEGFNFSINKTLPAMEGGNDITISDCLCFLNEINIGNRELASKALQKEAKTLGISEKDLADKILNQAGKIIADSLSQVIEHWEKEPKYKVWQIENQMKIYPEVLFLIGGPAKGLKKYIQNYIDIPVVVDSKAMTANALGAALAKESFSSYIRINTSEGTVSSGWGYFEEKTFSKRLHPDEGKEYALKITNKHLNNLGIKDIPQIYEHEIFSIVRDGYTSGQIHEIHLGLKPGIREGVKI